MQFFLQSYLLLNAMQAMPDYKGAVTVRTEFYEAENEVRIIVTDQGGGIAPEVRKHLFEAFYTTRIDKGWSGLGLYISNFIVSEHKGRLTVESGYNSGTVSNGIPSGGSRQFSRLNQTM
jgi:signal transduction histidine kinase